MTKTEVTGQITGRIIVTPNPVCFGQRCVVSWDTNDPAGAEVRVSTGANDEKLVAKGGKSGQVEIPWIADSTVYEFRLYPRSGPAVAIDSVKARREIDRAGVQRSRGDAGGVLGRPDRDGQLQVGTAATPRR